VTLPRLYVLNESPNAFTEVDTTSDGSGWLFARKTTHGGREVFVGVRQCGGTRSAIDLTNAPSNQQGNDPQPNGSDAEGGTTFQFQNNNPLAWEVSTSADESWSTFKSRLMANDPVVSGTRITFTSTKLGTTLDFDASSFTARTHKINGSAVDYATFDHGTHIESTGGYSWNNPKDAYEASARTNDFFCNWNWDPNNNNSVGVLERPNKTHGQVGGGTGPINPVVARAAIIDGALAGVFDPDGKAGDTYTWNTASYSVGPHNLEAEYVLQDDTSIRSPIRRHNVGVGSDPDAVARNRLKTKVGSFVDPTLRQRYEIVMGRPMQEMGRFSPDKEWGTKSTATVRSAVGSHMRYWEDIVADCNARYASGDRARVWVAVPPLMAAALHTGDARTLNEGVAGTYDEKIAQIGQVLAGLTDKKMVGIRWGWEGTATWYRWGLMSGVNGTPAESALAFKNYWIRYHDIIDDNVGTGAGDIEWDWNGTGGMPFNTIGGVTAEKNAWEASYPGDDYVDVVSIDAYHNWQFVQGWTNSAGTVTHVPITTSLTWVSNWAAAHGKKTALSEGSPWCWKWSAGAVHEQVALRSGEHASNIDFARRLLDWGLAEARANRLSHILIFERDKYDEGFFSFVVGIGDTSARATGVERTGAQIKLLHPWEHKKSGSNFVFRRTSDGAILTQATAWPPPTGSTVVGIPGAVPRPASTDGTYGAGGITDPAGIPPDTLGFRADVYTATASGQPGGPRGTNNGQTPAPDLLDFWLTQVGGPLT
jgi:hypothetical protein